MFIKRDRIYLKKIGLPVLILILLVGCNQRNTDLEDSINSIVKDENKSEIKIESLTDIDWDKAFIFTTYSTAEGIEKQLETKFNDKSNIDYRDDIYLLVFLYEDEVVQYVEINRLGFDFSIGEKKFLTAADDVIKIERH